MNNENVSNEKWLPIVGYEGIYEISNWGNIRSLDRVSFGLKRQTVHGRAISPGVVGKGYWGVNLWKDGKCKKGYLHQMVLLAFVGPRPACMDACHNDGDKRNNRLENLRWDTKANNHADKLKHGTILNGEKARAAKLTANQVFGIRAKIEEKTPFLEISRIYKISDATIRDIQHRRTWKHI